MKRLVATAAVCGLSLCGFTAVLTITAQAASAATFGTTSVGSNTDQFYVNRKRVNEYALSQEALVTKLSIYLEPTSNTATQLIKGIMYADSSGAPGALIAVSNELSFPNTDAAGWYDLTFPTPLSLAAGNYWIGVLIGGTVRAAQFRYTKVTNSRDTNANSYSSGPSDPFGAIQVVDSEQMSLYATYTPSSLPPPVNQTAPVVSGLLVVGTGLSTTNGSWTNDPMSYSYQWQRCASGSCSNISGATSSTYRTQNADHGDTVQALVTATNGGGSSSAVPSNPVGPIMFEGYTCVSPNRQYVVHPTSYAQEQLYVLEKWDCWYGGY
jgi:hypothetical protein